MISRKAKNGSWFGPYSRFEGLETFHKLSNYSYISYGTRYNNWTGEWFVLGKPHRLYAMQSDLKYTPYKYWRVNNKFLINFKGNKR